MNFFHHPYVNGDVAKYLVDNGVRFIGIDTINADQTGGTEFPVHDLFSEKRLMIGENWAFFDQIDFERPYVIALPMKLIGCDGSPVRAIAVQWRKNNGCEKKSGVMPEGCFAIIPSIFICALGVALLVWPEWGCDPLTTFEIGLSNVFHVQFGTVALVFEGIMFFVFFFVRRDLVHLGTLAWCFLIGPFENFWLDVLAPMLPTAPEMSVGLKIACILIGSIIIILTLAYYIRSV